MARLLLLSGAYLLLDVFVMLQIRPEEAIGLLLSFFWAIMLASIALLLPRLGGRIFFGVTYTLFLAWSLTQSGYYAVFHKLMWVRDLFYVSEGIGFLGDTLRTFTAGWWIGGVLLIAIGALLIWKFPEADLSRKTRISCICAIGISIIMFFVLPTLIFLTEDDLTLTDDTVSRRSAYNSMAEARRVYGICGIYQLTVRDVWAHEICQQTLSSEEDRQAQIEQINAYFDRRSDRQANEMTGAFADKHVVLVLMESMDDWLITPAETPTISRLMDEGITFENFYTPGYGTARTLNAEFCVNSGIFLPTAGEYVFDYLDNSFNQSLASLMVADGYSAEVYHYNEPTFYSRGELEPALGYRAYNSYGDYIVDGGEDQIYDECMLFDVQELYDSFFRDGMTFNTIITRSAHLGYTYEEELSEYALSVYPEYRGRYGSEDEDCIRVKAKLVDDMFARLLRELEANDRLENTVIIGVTDHYAYGMRDEAELLRLSGVEQTAFLERTPCFVWMADGPDMEVDKTLNTADFLPTVLNLLGIDSPYRYLGRDAFDPTYSGFVYFSDGSWISDGIACRVDTGGKVEVFANASGAELDEEYFTQMAETVQEYIKISNLLLTADYYSEVR